MFVLKNLKRKLRRAIKYVNLKLILTREFFFAELFIAITMLTVSGVSIPKGAIAGV